MSSPNANVYLIDLDQLLAALPFPMTLVQLRAFLSPLDAHPHAGLAHIPDVRPNVSDTTLTSGAGNDPACIDHEDAVINMGDANDDATEACGCGACCMDTADTDPDTDSTDGMDDPYCGCAMCLGEEMDDEHE